MGHKVLLADDSLTIQKVIKITLANEPYQIVECNNEKELLEKLKAEKPKLVFLDFTLSEEKSGYELAKEVKSISPNTKILIMYGTFDTIDDNLFKSSGASEKIVKPFDSTKFINICRNLVNEEDDEEMSIEELPPVDDDVDFPDDFPEDDIPPIQEELDENDDWVVDGPEAEEFVEEELPPIQEEKELNALESDMADWGMEVPGVIGEDHEMDEDVLPPVIDENSESIDPQISPEEIASLNENNILVESGEVKMPEEDDLEYPDLSSGPQLVSLDDLSQNDNYEEPVAEIEMRDEAQDLKNLEDQIEDDDESSEDLWSADEVQVNEVEEKIDDITFPDDFPEDDIPEPEAFEDEFDTPIFAAKEEVNKVTETKAIRAEVDIDEIVDIVLKKIEFKINDLIERKVEEVINKKFSSSSEKVAWEVIPDLAENLIRSEIKKITESVLNN